MLTTIHHPFFLLITDTMHTCRFTGNIANKSTTLVCQIGLSSPREWNPTLDPHMTWPAVKDPTIHEYMHAPYGSNSPVADALACLQDISISLLACCSARSRPRHRRSKPAVVGSGPCWKEDVYLCPRGVHPKDYIITPSARRPSFDVYSRSPRWKS